MALLAKQTAIVDRGHLDLRRLSPFQRILLTTDGTVTEILQAQYAEPIRLVKLFHGLTHANGGIPELDVKRDEVALRRILLRGTLTQRNYIYAETILVPSRLSPSIHAALRDTDKPVGQLMHEMRMETFREILRSRLEPARNIGAHFGIGAEAPVISRTYRIFAGSRPVMLITEKFPESAFKE